MTITDNTRKAEVFTFLNAVRNSEDVPSKEEYEAMKFTAPEIAQFLTEVDTYGEVPELDIELLREQITWARKSHEVQEPFAKMGWDQKLWMEADLIGQPTPIRNKDDMVVGYVAEDFCNSACCIAGSIALQMGEPLWQEAGPGRYGAHSMKNGESVDEFARKKLGLSHSEARIMFDEHCPIDFLESMAEAVCIRRGLEF